MKMLAWMYDHKGKSKILNDYIGEQIGVNLINEKMVKNRLWWF